MKTAKLTAKKRFLKMNNKIIKWLVLPITGAVLLAGCTAREANQAPVLRGINDISCLADSTVDLLNGVAALDAEDGDITPSLEISITPYVAVTNGYATFTKAGRYEAVYKTQDSAGLSARTTAYITVEEREVFRTDILTEGFSVRADGNAEIIAEGLTGSNYTFKFTGGEIAEDISLTRSFNLARGTEYTFTYYLKSNRSGNARAVADGSATAEFNISEGENVLHFTHTLPALNSGEDFGICEMQILLGELEGEAECSLSKVETQYAEQASGYAQIVENLDLNGKIINRDDLAQDFGVTGGGTSAFVEITQPAGQIWQMGLFVNTGVELKEGNEYVVSFGIESELDNYFEVCIQHEQFKDSDAVILSKPQGTVTQTIKAEGGFKGTLWLFIRSGAEANKLTVSNICVKKKLGGIKRETFSVQPVEAKHWGEGAGNVKTEYGKIIYTAESFGADWNTNEVIGTAFTLSGAAENYVISFKAKASSALSCAFIANTATGWNDFVWEKIRIFEEERVYTLRCHKKNLDGAYRFLWQFGTSENAGLKNVTVEISDIKIYYKSELDG